MYKIEYKDPKSLKFKTNNRNQHPREQIEMLKKIIEHNGFRVPVIVSNLSNEVVSGNGRLECAIEMGLSQIPVIYQDFKNADEEWQFHVADNASQDWSELDLSGINSDLAQIGPIDVSLLGIKDFLATPEEKEEDDSKGNHKPKIVTCPNCGEVFDT